MIVLSATDPICLLQRGSEAAYASPVSPITQQALTAIAFSIIPRQILVANVETSSPWLTVRYMTVNLISQMPAKPDLD
jgi:hypothetical protein